MPEEGAPARDEHRLMSPKAAISVGNSVLGAILGTAALVFIAQNMGPNVLGILGYSISAIGLLSFLSDFGVGSVHANLVRRGEDLGKCVGAYAVIKLVLLGVFAAVTLGLIELWRRGLLGGAMPNSYVVTDCLEVFLVYYLLLGICQIATHTYEAMGAVAKVQVPALLEVVVRVSFVVYISVSHFKAHPEAPALLAAAYAAGIIASTLLAALMLRNVKISRPDREILMTYVRSLAPVFVVTATIILDLYLDKVVVGYFWGPYELGLYFGAQKMAIFVSVFSLAMATLILPSVTTYFTRRDVAGSWDVVSQAERYVSLVVIPTAAFYLLYGREILSVLLGVGFEPALRTMDVLVVASTLVALVLPLRSAIAGVGKASTLFFVGLGGLVVQLTMLLVLVPDEILGVRMLGMKGLGAATALFVSAVYYFFVLRYMAWRSSRIVPTSHSFRHLVSAVFMVGVMYVLDWLLIPAVDFLALVLLAVAGTAVYALTAYMLGELEASDYRYFRSLLNPQDTYKYVVNELLGKRGH